MAQTGGKENIQTSKFQFVRVVDGAGAIIQKPFWPGAGAVKQRTARGDPKKP